MQKKCLKKIVIQENAYVLFSCIERSGNDGSRLDTEYTLDSADPGQPFQKGWPVVTGAG
jgi:hypothetical protein